MRVPARVRTGTYTQIEKKWMSIEPVSLSGQMRHICDHILYIYVWMWCCQLIYSQFDDLTVSLFSF